MRHKVSDWSVAVVSVKYLVHSAEEVQRIVDGGQPDVYAADDVSEITIRQTRTVRLVSDMRKADMDRAAERRKRLPEAWVEVVGGR